MSWQAPDRNGGPEIEGYNLRYRVSGTTPWTGERQGVTGTSATIGGLAPDTDYEVQVQALNGETPSDWSASGTGSTASRPVVTLVESPSSITENGGTATVSATVSPVSTAAFTVTVAVQPAQFTTLSSNAVLSFEAGAGSSTGTVTITGVNNDEDAPDRHVSVTGAVSGGEVTAPSSVTLTLVDDDEAPAGAVAVTVTSSSSTGVSLSWPASEAFDRPFYSANLKLAGQDGGDAETGRGMDIGGGLAFTDSVTGLSLDVRMRTLVVHQAEGFTERGTSLSFGWDPTPSSPLGFTARVARSWGGSAMGGADALWRSQMAHGMGSHRWPAPAARSTRRSATGCRQAGSSERRTSASRRLSTGATTGSACSNGARWNSASTCRARGGRAPCPRSRTTRLSRGRG